MPVINLPRDTRWGDLGTALGGLVGNVVAGARQAEVAQGVADIVADPALSENDKGVQALKKFGEPGYNFYKDFVKTQVLQGQLKDVLAQAGVRSLQGQVIQRQLSAGTPELEAQKLGAQTGLLGAQTTQTQEEAARTKLLSPIEAGLKGAQTTNVQQQTTESQTLLPGRVKEQEANTAKTQVQALQGNAAIPGTEAESELARLKVDQTKMMLEQQRKMLVEGTSTLTNILTSVGIDPRSVRGQQAFQAYMNEPDPSKKYSAFSAVVEKGVSEAEHQARPQPVTDATQNRIVAAATQVESTEKFLDAFVKRGASKIGWWPNAAPAQALMEKLGWPTGDTELVSMFNSALQQAADTATQGGGFYAEGRLRVAKETTPNIAGTPLHAMIAMDEVAGRKLSELKVVRDNLTPGQPRAAIDATIKRWEQIKATTGSLRSYTSTPWTVQVQMPDGSTTTREVRVRNSDDPPPQGMELAGGGKIVGGSQRPGKTSDVVMFQGNQIDPYTFKVVLDKNAVLPLAKGVDITGQKLMEDADRLGVTPEQLLQGLRGYYGNQRVPAATAPVR